MNQNRKTLSVPRCLQTEGCHSFVDPRGRLTEGRHE